MECRPAKLWIWVVELQIRKSTVPKIFIFFNKQKTIQNWVNVCQVSRRNTLLFIYSFIE